MNDLGVIFINEYIGEKVFAFGVVLGSVYGYIR